MDFGGLNATGSESDDDSDVEELTPKYTPALCPHGELVRVTENVFMVRGSYQVTFGVRIPRTMTIIKAPDTKGKKGGLTLVNAVRVDEKVLSQINIMGRVKHVIRLSHYHGCDDYFYLRTYKGARHWQLKKEKPFNGGIRKQIDKKYKMILKEGDDGCPIEGAQVVVMKYCKFPEAMIWIPNGAGTLITGDAVTNFTLPPPLPKDEDEKEALKKRQEAKKKKGGDDEYEDYANFGGRSYLRVNGAYQPNTCLPWYYRPQTNDPNGGDFYKNFQRILKADFPKFQTLITGYGPPEIGDAKKILGQELAKVWPNNIVIPEDSDDESSEEEDSDEE